MKAGFATSLAGHAMLIGIGIVGLAHVETLEPTEIEAIAVDLVPIEEIASIRTGSEESDVIETNTPAVVDTPDPVPLAERPGSTQTDQPRPEETLKESPAPTVQTAPAPLARPEPQPEPEPTPEPEPEPLPEPEPIPEPEPEPEPEPVAEQPVLAAEPTEAEPAEVAPTPVLRTASLETLRKQFVDQERERERREAAAKAAEAEQKRKDQEAAEKAKEADKVADIINAESSRGATTGTGGQQAAGKPSGQAQRLSQSELGALIAQMQRCWNPGFQERADGVVIRLMVAMNTNGTVAGTQVLTDTAGSPMLGLSARNAARKIQNCSYSLPSDKYDHWREIDVTLDASQAN